MAGGIPVSQFLAKSGGTRIAIIRSVTKDAPSGIMAEDIVALIKKEVPNAAIALHDLSHDGTRTNSEGHPLVGAKLYPCDGCHSGGGRRCLLPCDRNDVESDIFEGDDKGVEIYESLGRAALIVIIGEAHCGGLDSRMQRFVERLMPYRNLKDDGKAPLRDKVAVVTVVGAGSSAVAGNLVGHLSGIDLAIPPGGVLALDIYDDMPREAAVAEYKKNTNVRSALEEMISSGLRLVKKLTRD